MSGLKKHFNAETTSGRANVAKVTYASIAMLYLFYRIKRKKKTPKQPEPAAVPLPPGPEHSEAAPPSNHERRFIAPPPPPPQHDNSAGDAHDSRTEGTQTATNGGDQQQQPQSDSDAHAAEKQHAADVLTGTFSSHAAKAATPSTNGGSCGTSNK